MCGINGIIKVKGPTLTDDQQEQWQRLMTALTALSAARGMDSTGIIRASAAGQVNIAKDAVPAWEFLARATWRKLARPDASTFATIGHTRLATHGAVTAGNAHPFKFTAPSGDVTAGVHNGVVDNHAKFAVGSTTYVVDSANLIAALATARPTEWGQLLRKAKGTLALALARSHKGRTTVYLTRRANPLWVAWVAELQALAFASTKEILTNAISRSRLTAVDAKEIPEGVTYAYRTDGTLKTTRWWRPRRAVKRARQQWSLPLDTSPAALVAPTTDRELGGDGREYQQCGSCLDWAEPYDLHFLNGAVLCGSCHTAARSWQKKQPKGVKP